MAGLSAQRQSLKTTAESAASAPYAFASADRVKLAYSQFAPTDEILKTLVTAGPLLVILEGEKIEDMGGEVQNPSPKRYRILSRLYIGFEREADNTFVAIEDFVEAIANAWRASSINVVDTNFSRPEINTDRNPAIAMYELQIEVFGC